MSPSKNITQINEEFEECRTVFKQLQKADILDKNIQGMLQVVFDPDITLYPEAKIKIIEKFRTGLIDLLQDEMDPKFTIILKNINIVIGLRDVFQKMGIQTLGDVVKYKDIEDFTSDYQEKIKKIDYKRTNGSQLSARIEQQLKLFMKENRVSFGMSTKLSDKILADQEKMKKLLGLSFDLSTLENRKAMKEYGIDNTGGVFIKLFDHGIENFQQLLKKYNSINDIEIDGFGKLGKGKLIDMMQKNNISFGMDISSYI